MRLVFLERHLSRVAPRTGMPPGTMNRHRRHSISWYCSVAESTRPSEFKFSVHRTRSPHRDVMPAGELDSPASLIPNPGNHGQLRHPH